MAWALNNPHWQIYGNGERNGKHDGLKEICSVGSDIIVVPYKLKKEREWLRSTGSMVGTIASIATTVFVIDRLR